MSEVPSRPELRHFWAGIPIIRWAPNPMVGAPIFVSSEVGGGGKRNFGGLRVDRGGTSAALDSSMCEPYF